MGCEPGDLCGPSIAIMLKILRFSSNRQPIQLDLFRKTDVGRTSTGRNRVERLAESAEYLKEHPDAPRGCARKIRRTAQGSGIRGWPKWR
jgi:hypothetical protein